ncbi:MAG: Lrp/AsnC family transcriptional regulator [Candidatus Woesearchaeota archaeon]
MERKKELALDKRDKDLLYLLDISGRLTYSQLAKKTKMSKQLVKYRIERLEKEGFIKGYFPMIDTSKLGYTTFRLYLKFRNITPTKKEEIIEYLKKQKSIWAVILISGKWDIALGISVKDIYGYYAIWEDILKKYLPNIADYKTSIYSPIYHYSKAYLVEKEDESKIRILGGNEKTSFDELDINILKKLSKNARTSLVDISNELKKSAELISFRMKQLEKKGIIQGYRAMIDVEKFGYEFYKTEIRLSSYENINQILSFCHRHPNIYQTDKTIGGETIEIEFHVKSLKQMLAIIGELEKHFPKTIDWFEYITILSEEKTTYMPEI